MRTPGVPAGTGAVGCGIGRACGGVPPPLDAASLARNHPCYGEEAHHHFARLHVAVAPACNVQCHYCNRKYDCASESRPGVTSERLSPADAVRKVLAVAAEVPELAVVGIAGPGDALANPEATFATLEGVRCAAPDLFLCVATNGLGLPDHAARLVALGVRHVTVTVNMIDPAVGERIYPWIVREGRKVRGPEASRILSVRQLEGIAALAARGVLVKVNSVVIPGVNDAHLPDVARAVRRAGASLLNLVPLVSAPEHGTHYGTTGQRAPTPEELERVRDACGIDAPLMRHCRQCRADAVGRLSEDRFERFVGLAGGTGGAAPPGSRLRLAAARDAAELRAEHRSAVDRAREIAAREREAVLARLSDVPAALTARVAVATRAGGLVDQHFGHARELLVYDVSRRGARLVARRAVGAYCGGGEGDGEVLAAALRAMADCRAVLAARIGRCPRERLAAAGVEPVTDQAFRPIEAAALAWFERFAARASPPAPRGAAPASPGDQVAGTRA